LKCLASFSGSGSSVWCIGRLISQTLTTATTVSSTISNQGSSQIVNDPFCGRQAMIFETMAVIK
jgi:hypothetical protein